MALRIRKDGRVLCAAMHPEEPGDTYLDDGIHYQLSAERRLLVTEQMESHKDRGEWWWAGNVPPEITVDDFYRGPTHDDNVDAFYALRDDLREMAERHESLWRHFYERVKAIKITPPNAKRTGL